MNPKNPKVPAMWGSIKAQYPLSATSYSRARLETTSRDKALKLAMQEMWRYFRVVPSPSG